jgi:hypothetical protein
MATLTVTAPDGKTLSVDLPQGVDPSTYPAIAEEVVQDYQQKTGQETAAQFSARTEGPGSVDATVSDFLGPYLTGEISEATGLTAALGKLFSKVGGTAPEFLGWVMEKLTPNQNSRLLAFIRSNPEWYSMVQTQMKNAGTAIASTVGEETPVTAGFPTLAKAGITTATGEAVPATTTTVGEMASGALSDLKEAAKPAMDIFKASPDAFIDHLQSIVNSAPDATKLSDFAPADRGFLYAAYQLIQKGGSRSILTRFLGAGLVAKLASLIAGPVGGAIGGALEYGLESPAGGALAQQLAGRTAQFMGNVAGAVGEKVPYALPGVSQALQGGNQ